MYNEYFGLRQAPFRITPDTALFYTGGKRGDVLDALVYAITSGEGIVKVVGEVGTGKTMLCRMLEERLPENVQIAYLANPSLTPEDILHAVALELELDLAGDAKRLQVMHRLQETLLARHANNQRVVVLVEEAQSMPVDTLEEIRLLSNLETKNEKLLQIVLFGQPELDENLAKTQIRQLRERITHSFALTPLGRDEVKDYVAFRLRASGYRGRDAFTSDAYRVMSRASEGLTRRVNIIADKAMLAAFADDTHDVSAKHVKSAIADSEFSVRRPRALQAPLFALAIVAVVVAGAVGWYAGNQTRTPTGAAAMSAGEASSSPLPEPARTAQQQSRQHEALPVPAMRSQQEPVKVAANVAVSTVEIPAATAPAVTAASAVTSVAAASALPNSQPTSAPDTVVASALARATTVPPTAQAPAPSTALDASSAVALTQTAESALPGAGTGSIASVNPVGDSNRLTHARVDGAAATRDELVTSGDRNGQAPTMAIAPPGSGASATQRLSAARQPVSVVPTHARQTAVSLLIATPQAEASESGAAPHGAGSNTDSATTALAVGTAATVASTPAAAAEQAPTSVASGKEAYETLLQWRLARTEEWLRQVSKNHYSIQLLATDAGQRRNLEAFLVRREQAGHIKQVFVYETQINARGWYGVLFGEFASYTQAREALRELPRELQVHQPFIRNIKDINVLG